MNYVFDTNAVIHFVCDTGDFSILSKTDNFYISFISYIELSVGYKTKQEKEATNIFIKKADQVLIDTNIIKLTIDIRKKFGLKLPDSVIVATAISKNSTLITSDKEIIKKSLQMDVKILDPLSTEIDQ